MPFHASSANKTAETHCSATTHSTRIAADEAMVVDATVVDATVVVVGGGVVAVVLVVVVGKYLSNVSCVLQFAVVQYTALSPLYKSVDGYSTVSNLFNEQNVQFNRTKPPIFEFFEASLLLIA